MAAGSFKSGAAGRAGGKQAGGIMRRPLAIPGCCLATAVTLLPPLLLLLLPPPARGLPPRRPGAPGNPRPQI